MAWVNGTALVRRITSLLLAVTSLHFGAPRAVYSKSKPSPREGSTFEAVMMPGLLPGPTVPAPPMVVFVSVPLPPSLAPPETVTEVLASDPLTTSVPLVTSVDPV